MPDPEEQIELLFKEREHFIDQYEEEWEIATEEPTDIPELSDGEISREAMDNLTDREKAVYHLGRRSGMWEGLLRMDRVLEEEADRD